MQRMRWHVLEDLIREHKFKIFVEVGVFRGETCGYLLGHVRDKDFLVYAVDPYVEYNAYRKMDFEEIKAEAHYRAFQDDRCMHIEKFSTEAAKDFSDGSVDLVFIDGNHRYKWVVADIASWWPKVREGGILSGHDFWSVKGGKNRGVRYAVKYFCRDNKLTFNRGDDGVWWIEKPFAQKAK